MSGMTEPAGWVPPRECGLGSCRLLYRIFQQSQEPDLRIWGVKQIEHDRVPKKAGKSSAPCMAILCLLSNGHSVLATQS